MQPKKPDLNELFKRYCSGEATRHERDQLERWLFQLNVQGEEIFESPAEEEQVKSRIRQAVFVHVHAQPRNVIALWWRAAAALALLVTASVAVYQWTRSAEPQTIMFQADATPLTGIKLPDGTVVSLNRFSSLEYTDTEFNTAQRKVKLTGEGFFDVAENKNKPFLVTTDAVETVVLGTAFNIESYPNEQRIRISLIRGRVVVNQASGDRSISVLTPGNMLEFNRADSAHAVVPVALEDPQSWMEGKLNFNNMQLADAFQKLERHYGIDIDVAEELVRGKSVTAQFTNSSWEDVLSNILFVYDLRYTEAQNKISIHR